MSIERTLSDRLAKRVGEIPAREIPRAQRDLATTVGIHTDKAELYAGSPMAVTVTEFAATLRELHELGVEIKLTEDDGSETIDATAIEETAPEGITP